MASFTLQQVTAAVDAAFQTAAQQNPVQSAAPRAIADNATIRTDVYSGPKGLGFAVTAVLDLHYRKLVITRQSGPEPLRERPAPSLASLLAECDARRAAAYDARGCSTRDYVDAVTKQASSDPAMKAEGEAQLAAVLAARLQVKTDFPKLE